MSFWKKILGGASSRAQVAPVTPGPSVFAPQGNMNARLRSIQLNRAVDDAILSGDAQALGRLLAMGADVERADSSHTTLLQWASQLGNEKVVEVLLTSGASVESKDDLGVTPLMFAAHKGHEAVVDLLLSKGADPDKKNDSGFSSIHIAAILGHAAVARALIAAGTDVNAKDNTGATALQYATKNGHSMVVEVLSNASMDPAASNPTPAPPEAVCEKPTSEFLSNEVARFIADLETAVAKEDFLMERNIRDVIVAFGRRDEFAAEITGKLASAALRFNPDDPGDDADRAMFHSARACLGVIEEIGTLREDSAEAIFRRFVFKRSGRDTEAAGWLGVFRQAVNTLTKCGYEPITAEGASASSLRAEGHKP
jgi:hypothetical protein